MSDFPNSYEIEVLQMCSGTKDWPQQPAAWVNACVEFLQGNGYITQDLKLTDKAKRLFTE